MARLSHRTAPGCTYFVTTKTWENRAILRPPEVAQILVACLLKYRDQGAYALHEFVVMPDHLHLLLTPGPTTALEKAVQFIKGGSSYEIHKQRNHKMEIWQPWFHEWTVRDARDYAARMHYIHANPVVGGLSESPVAWLYGSASGRYQIDEPPQGLKPLSITRGNVGA